jgi:hypothetical protein
MITIQMSLEKQTVAGVINAATCQGISFNDYVQLLLDESLSIIAKNPIESIKRSDKLSPEIIASSLRDYAYSQVKDTDGQDIEDEDFISSAPFLLETLYQKFGKGDDWNELDKGYRIALGKSFRRLINIPVVLDSNPNLSVWLRFLDTDNQNKSIYVTDVAPNSYFEKKLISLA